MSLEDHSATATEVSRSSVRILVAEDDADLRGTLSRNLSASGHVVVGEAATMIEAMDRVRELSPDVLLLDAHLGPTKML
jgi:CheY-like chemotaxis protein